MNLTRLIQMPATILIVSVIMLFSFAIAGQPLFKKLSVSETGISFQNKLVETPEANIITYEYFYNGGGVAAGDFNNDGLIDLYFTANLAENKLYLNTGNFKFKDVTKAAGAGGKKGWKTGVSIADVNGDGFLDIYLCYSGDVDEAYRHNQLLINNGNLTFTDKAKIMGVDDVGYTTHAAFFDMDRDGDLDLYVLNHNIKNLRNFDAAFVKKMVDPDAGDRLYENVNGKFINITQKSGIISNPLGYGLGINIADINNDGWPDIYVTNDYVEEDYMYMNNKNGTFTESLKQQISHISNFSMGVDIADINNDGWLDIFTLDMLPEDNKRQKLLFAPDNYEVYNNMVQNGFHHQLMRNMLQVNNGNGTFSEVGQVCGISNTDWSWAALLADFNNDGNMDLYVTNGYGRDMINRDFMKFYANERLKHLQGKTDDKMFKMLQTIKATPLHNYIFENRGNFSFTDKSVEWGFDKADFSHGAIYADLDNDGDLDIIDNKMNDFAGVYKNNSVELKMGKNFIKFDLRTTSPNIFAIGSRVSVYTNTGTQTKEYYPVHGFQSSMCGPLHFGLSDSKVDSVVVTWPDGKKQKFTENLKINTTVNLNQNSKLDYKISQKTIKPIFSQSVDFINFLHKERPKNDFKIQPLMTDMISYNGPKMAVGDINKDGLDDIYICGSASEAGSIFIQNTSGVFEASTQPDIHQDSKYEDTDAIFFDADGDKDQDLYIVSGGFIAGLNADLMQDRFYLNVGGTFFAKPNRIPKENHSGSVVVALDFDTDGDMDLFVGGRVVPGRYPESPGSLLLINDGKGNFSDGTESHAAEFRKIGMVTDAKWVDINNDGKPELVVCGDWMTLECYNFESGHFNNTSKIFFSEKYLGWWKTLYVSDLDNDGDVDIIAGNFGENTQIRVSVKEPAELYFADFDNNGFIDPILCYYVQGKSYPMATRDELTDQIVSLRQSYVTYDSYCNATIDDIFKKDQITSSPKLTADFLKTTWFENVNGKFEIRSLPKEANFAPVYAISVDDFNKDGHADILLAGNVEQTRVKMGRIDANTGCLLFGDGRGNFTYTSQVESGLSIKGAVRSLESIHSANNYKFYIVGLNGHKPVKVSINEK